MTTTELPKADGTSAPAADTKPASPAPAGVADGKGQQKEQPKEQPTPPTEEPKAGQSEGDNAGDTPQGAPESYTEFVVPEGVTLDPAMRDAWSEVARELDLPQDSAQKVVDKLVPVLARRDAERQTALANEWEQATRSDADIGGEHLEANLALAKKAIDTFGNDELRTLLRTPFGSHPEVVRFMHAVGKAIGEDDRFVSAGEGGKPAPKTLAKRIYGGAKKET